MFYTAIEHKQPSLGRSSSRQAHIKKSGNAPNPDSGTQTLGYRLKVNSAAALDLSNSRNAEGDTAVLQGTVAHARGGTQAKAEGLEAQRYPWLHGELKASQGFLKFCLNNKNNNGDNNEH